MNRILSDFLSDTITSLEYLRKNDVCKEFSCIFNVQNWKIILIIILLSQYNFANCSRS